eukprot:1149389-Pelagomonas_calceolata.AAC.6
MITSATTGRPWSLMLIESFLVRALPDVAPPAGRTGADPSQQPQPTSPPPSPPPLLPLPVLTPSRLPLQPHTNNEVNSYQAPSAPCSVLVSRKKRKAEEAGVGALPGASYTTIPSHSIQVLQQQQEQEADHLAQRSVKRQAMHEEVASVPRPSSIGWESSTRSDFGCASGFGD